MAKHPNHVDVQVGMRVRSRRLLIKMSQEKLGDALGLTFQQVQKYEKGTNRIGASRLVQIAGVLKCKAEDFVEGLSPDAKLMNVAGDGQLSISEVNSFLSSANGIEIVRAFTKVRGKKRQQAIVNVVRSMVD